jgi:Ca-activated chloride channel family protein
MVGPRPGPGRLVVRLDSPATARQVKPARTLMVVLDCSGSMNESLGAERKIDVAKRILIDMVRNLPAGAPVGLRVYGRRLHHKDPGTCQDRELLIPPGPLDPDAFVRSVESLTARGETPLVGSIVDAAADIPPGSGERAIMAVTDGLETCGGTESDLAGLLTSGTDFVKVNVVGFGLGDPAERERLESLVAACRGSYIDARDAAALEAAVQAQASSRWIAIDAGGATAAEGTLTGAGASLPSGEYLVRIECTPPLESKVRIASRKDSELVVHLDSTGRPALSGAR